MHTFDGFSHCCDKSKVSEIGIVSSKVREVGVL